MAVTDGNLQDYLADPGGDTLYWKGAQVEIGTSTASTINLIFSNSVGQIALQAVPAAGSISISLPTGSGSLLTAVNVSAGTTSNNLSNIVFANSNGVTFGLNGSTVTATVQAGAAAGIAALAAGTQTATSGTVVYSNSNNVSFGMSNSSVVTASAQVNISAGTTSNNLSAVTFSNLNNVSFGLNGSVVTASATVASTQGSINLSAGTTSNLASAFTFSNSNGVSFGLNSSVVTAALGGMSAWQNGNIVATFSHSQGLFYFQPIVIPYNLTATLAIWLASLTQTNATASTGAKTVSLVVYTLNAGTQLSWASSASTQLSWSSGASFSAISGNQYRSMTLNSWGFTPGMYLLGWNVSTANSVSITHYAPSSQASIQSGTGLVLTNILAPGISNAAGAFQNTIALSNTTAFIRTGSSIFNQPWISFQGT